MTRLTNGKNLPSIVLNRWMIAIIKFISYLPETGVKKEMVLQSVSGLAWTQLQTIPKPMYNAFNILLQDKFIEEKEGRFFLTLDGKHIAQNIEKNKQ